MSDTPFGAPFPFSASVCTTGAKSSIPISFKYANAEDGTSSQTVSSTPMDPALDQRYKFLLAANQSSTEQVHPNPF